MWVTSTVDFYQLRNILKSWGVKLTNPISALHYFHFCCFGKRDVSSNVWLSEWVLSNTDCYRETNYPDQPGLVSDSIITDIFAAQRPNAWVQLPVGERGRVRTWDWVWGGLNPPRTPVSCPRLWDLSTGLWVSELGPDLVQLEEASDQSSVGADRSKVNSRGHWAGR